MIRERDVVRVYAGTKDGRTGVVMRIFPDQERAVVLTGTSSTYVHEPSIEVKCNERAGKVLGLTSPVTYFRKSGFARPKLEDIEPLGKQCPPELFTKLQRLIGIVASSSAPVRCDEGPRPVLEKAALEHAVVSMFKSDTLDPAPEQKSESGDPRQGEQSDTTESNADVVTTDEPLTRQ